MPINSDFRYLLATERMEELLAGHSKWKNIQHRKGAQDKKRGKIFTKIGVEIQVSVKLGGDDPESNPRLRSALAKARSANMPKDVITRSIKKAMGDGASNDYMEKNYEGYGPGGVAIFVECLTDNVNRTVMEVRHAFSRNGGNMGTEGSVAWMFQRKGLIIYDSSKIDDFDKLFEIALENGAEDVVNEDGQIEITCDIADMLTLKEELDKTYDEPDVCELARIAENTQEISSEQNETLEKLVEALEDKDDVQNVFHNAETKD